LIRGEVIKIIHKFLFYRNDNNLKIEL
jgi:hypothetical protein